jgi:acyl-ACP thioesterase
MLGLNLLFHEKETVDRKRIYFYECDWKNRLKISTILRISSEIAGYDYTRRGLSYEFLRERDMAFLLSKISLKVKKNPHEAMEIVTKTWEQGHQKSVFKRGFSISSADESELVCGTSDWVLVNPKTRRIIRPQNFAHELPQSPERAGDELPTAKIAYENLHELGKVTVYRSMLDANFHVYNAVYADFVFDFLPDVARDIEHFRMNFNAEASLGDSIEIFGKQSENHAVIVGKIEAKVCFEAEVFFKS